jgi:hypothetical protein
MDTDLQVGDGIAEMRKIEDARKALKTVGFDILYEEDLAERMSFLCICLPCLRRPSVLISMR